MTTTASRRGRRSPAADLHLLPPGAGRRGAGRADAAHARRARDRGDRARVPGAAPRRWRSGWCARRRRSATRASRTASPTPDELPERLDAVLAVVYLIFNEGYAASCGRDAGPARAVRRGDPPRPAAGRADAGSPEARALLALMLLHDARARRARRRRRRAGAARGAGSRALGSRAIREGAGAGRRRAWRAGRAGPYALQAAIAAVHARAPRAADTDWREIARSTRCWPGAPVAGGRAQPRGRGRDGRRSGGRAASGSTRWRRVARSAATTCLPAARADLLRRLGRNAEAACSVSRGAGAGRQRGRGAVPQAAAGRGGGRVGKSGPQAPCATRRV